MGRHDGTPGDDDVVRGLGPGGKLVVAFISVVAVVGAGALLAPEDVLGRIPWAQQPQCPATTVRLVVEPELDGVVREILAPLAGERLGDTCLRIDVTAQEGDETAASSEILPADRAPQLWIPDSQAWIQKAPSWRMQPAATFASSPVVVTTSKAAAQRLGWMAGRPTWNQALRGERPAAVPDIATHSDSLAALIALWQTLGKGTEADQAVVNLVVAADRGEVPTAEQALAVARSGSVNSPVVPATEQAVAAANATAGTPELAAVYPSEGSPILTYPVTRVIAAAESADLRAATAVVVERLRSAVAPAVARKYGFRGPDLSPATSGAGIYGGSVTSLLSPGRAEVDAMIDRVEEIGRPSRILCLLDVSLSMKEPLDDGLRRLDLAAAAARLGANVLPNAAAVGAWVFASEFADGKDYREVAPVQPLGSRAGRGEVHRANLIRLTENPDRYLKAGGTSIYDTALAASRRMHETYDARAVHGIILLSDGSNEDATGETLDGLIAELRRVNAGDRKVPFYTAAIGPDADFTALRRIADASGGHAYVINSAAEGQAALLDGLRRSRNLGSGG